MNKTLTRDRRRILRAEHLSLTPYTIWAVLFILVPLVFVAYYAFTDDNFAFTLENIQRFFVSTSTVFQEDGSSQEVRTYLLIFWRSLKLAIISTLVCLVLAYPLAYIMARAKPRTQKVFLTIIMIPMWMNFLIRTYAWMTILQDTGIFNNFLTLLHLPNIHIIGTKGEIKGIFDDSVYTIRSIDTASEEGWQEKTVDLKISGDKSGITGSHGGGDLLLVEDFVRILQGRAPSLSCTSLADSVNGHLTVFRAEKARKTSSVQPIDAV